MSKPLLLAQEIQMLNLSVELKTACLRNGIETLDEFIRKGSEGILSLPGFRTALVFEVVSFLEDQGMDEAIEQFEDN